MNGHSSATQPRPSEPVPSGPANWQAAWQAYQQASCAVFLKPSGGGAALSLGLRHAVSIEGPQDLERACTASLARGEGSRVAFLLAFQPDACRGLWGGLPPGMAMAPEQWVPAPEGWPQASAEPAPNCSPQQRRLTPGRREWAKRVRRTTAAVASRAVDKVVLARRMDLVFDQPIDVAGTVAQLSRDNPEATVWSWRLGGRDFVGASPELLVSYRQGRLETACVAGTLLDGAMGAAGRWRDKERHEQAVVEDYVDRAFRSVGLTPIHSQLTEVRQGSFRHLTATVAAEANTVRSFYDLLTLLHPTPALAGEPRRAALEWIRRQEPFGRGYYGGVVGWVEESGAAEAVVAIRSALLRGPRAHLFAGGGLVGGSEPDAEWKETEAKLGVVNSALRWGGADGQR